MTGPDAAASGRGRKRACPICGKPAVEDYAPFCSKRCTEVDLHRWLSGSYAIPAVEADDDTDENARSDERND